MCLLWVLFLLCVSRTAHGKKPLCRGPDFALTANTQAHDKLDVPVVHIRTLILRSHYKRFDIRRRSIDVTEMVIFVMFCILLCSGDENMMIVA